MTSTIFKHLEDDKDSMGVSEIIKDKLYFVTYKNKTPEDHETTHFFTEDDDEENYVNLSTIALYFQRVNDKLSSPDLSSKTLVQYSSGSEKRRGEAAMLVGAYLVVHLKKDPIEVSERLVEHTAISIKDRMTALHKAVQFGLVDFEDFNVDDFEVYDRIALNWVVPGKLLVFSGPLTSADDYYMSPKNYLKHFKQAGVNTLVRLSHRKYDANPFVDERRLDHYDLGMDSTTPSDMVLDCFLEICETSPGGVAVHCRELLGRAGSLVAALLVKHYRMSSREAAAWVTLATSDHLLETQKKWLKKVEELLRSDGDGFRLEVFGSEDAIPRHRRGVYSYGRLGERDLDHSEENETEDVLKAGLWNLSVSR